MTREGQATPLLDSISSPDELKALSYEQCEALAGEIRSFIVETVSRTGGHLGSNLGAVELTIALHRVFSSPRDVILFDTGHQAYVHKLLTGRKGRFSDLRRRGGLSGYPNRKESDHDVIENSHASTALSWAHGIASARTLAGADHHVVAVVGDGALTGGMAYEALNNLGHSGTRVVIVLNDNGRSYAPTVSKLSESITQLRLDPRYMRIRDALREAIGDVPVMGQLAEQSFRGLTSAVREVVEPHVFFEALGVRYTGPLDGHDVEEVEQALKKASSWNGPIVLHLLTTKGKGYEPAERDEIARLHDLKPPIAPSDQGGDPPLSEEEKKGRSFTEAFSKALVKEAAKDKEIVAITAAMPGPTGLLGFEEAYPERFFDVGIAESHAMTMSAGMARGGLKPVLCVYSTFLQRCVDQWNLDVGLHGAHVVVVADRAGITGDDGPSHHGIYDIHSALLVEKMAIYAPSEPSEVAPLLAEALSYSGPCLFRYPKTPFVGSLGPSGAAGSHRVLNEGDGKVVLVGIGKLAKACLEASSLAALEGLEPLVIDPRVLRPVREELLEILSAAELVVTAEDGVVIGGAGSYMRALVEERARELSISPPRFLNLGVPASYIAQAKPDEILSDLRLDGPGIAEVLVKEAGLVGLEEREKPQRALRSRPAHRQNGSSSVREEEISHLHDSPAYARRRP